MNLSDVTVGDLVMLFLKGVMALGILWIGAWILIGVGFVVFGTIGAFFAGVADIFKGADNDVRAMTLVPNTGKQPPSRPFTIVFGVLVSILGVMIGGAVWLANWNPKRTPTPEQIEFNTGRYDPDGRYILRPGERRHLIRDSETVGDIAHNFGVDVSALLKRNHVSANNVAAFRAGQVIIVPPAPQPAGSQPRP
jgi:hypothetical protein